MDSKSFKLQIWDTAGQERFRIIISSYEISELEFFQNWNAWLIEIEKNASKNVYKI